MVEATAKGGALIAADIANSYNRDVYAFSGRTTDVSSEGCNFLNKTNRAALINHAKDRACYLGWDEVKSKKTKQTQLMIGRSSEEQRIVDLLQVSAIGIDELAIQSEIP